MKVKGYNLKLNLKFIYMNIVGNDYSSFLHSVQSKHVLETKTVLFVVQLL